MRVPVVLITLSIISEVPLGVADAEKKFLVIDVVAHGKQSDEGIFFGSELFTML